MKCKTGCGRDQDRQAYTSPITGEECEETLCAYCRNKVALSAYEDNWHVHDKKRYATSLGVDQ